MPRGAGDSPWLRKQVLTRLIETNASNEYENDFPIQKLFMLGNGGRPRLVTAAEGLIPVRTAARRRGRYHSRPTTADLFKADRMGRKEFSVFFQRYKGHLPADAVARLAYPIPDQLPGAMAMNQEAENQLLYLGQVGAETILREREILCCQMLAEQAFQVKVDEVDVDFATGIATPTNASSDWNVKTADIPGDLGKFTRIFRRLTGAKFPTHMIYHGVQTENFAKNDRIFTWSERYAGSKSIIELPTELLPAELKTAEQIVMDSFYEDLDGTSKDYWSQENIMTWINLSKPDRVLDMLTTGTLADEFQGDMFGKRVINDEDDSVWVHAGGNAIPVILDEAQIVQFKLNPA
jgi:hypothetical protein